MQTTIPLTRLTLLRPADLLPLLGSPDAQVLAVETWDVPAGTMWLAPLLRLRSPAGQEYLHVIAWQDTLADGVCSQFADSLAWLRQHTPDHAVLGTLIALRPTDARDPTRTWPSAGPVGQPRLLTCLRLWEQDAAMALASGRPGLIAVSPLMGNAHRARVAQAVAALLRQTDLPHQTDLLVILGICARPLLSPEQFFALVGTEVLMQSTLLDAVAGEKMARLEAQLAETEAELAATKAAQPAAMARLLQDTLAALIGARFPQAPIVLMRDIRRITDPDTLQRLMVAVVQVADLAALERLLAETVSPA